MSVNKRLPSTVYKNLYDLLIINDGYSFGQKLHVIQHKMKKKFYEASNEDINTALEELLRDKDYFEDEPLTNYKDESYTE